MNTYDLLADGASIHQKYIEGPSVYTNLSAIREAEASKESAPGRLKGVFCEQEMVSRWTR